MDFGLLHAYEIDSIVTFFEELKSVHTFCDGLQVLSVAWVFYQLVPHHREKVIIGMFKGVNDPDTTLSGVLRQHDVQEIPYLQVLEVSSF
jgi:hypothetical protein